MTVADALNQAGVESRAGCHCATLAHRALGLTPPASCRLSFYFYNTLDEVDQAVAAVAAVVAGRPAPATFWHWFRRGPPGRRWYRDRVSASAAGRPSDSAAQTSAARNEAGRSLIESSPPHCFGQIGWAMAVATG